MIYAPFGVHFHLPPKISHISKSLQNSTHTPKQKVTRLSIITFFSSGISLFYDFQVSVKGLLKMCNYFSVDLGGGG